MVSYKDQHNKSYNKPGHGGEPKAGAKASGFESFSRKDKSLKRSTTLNVDMETFRLIRQDQMITFKRNQHEMDVRRALFLMEGEEKFASLSVRAKMTMVVKRGSEDMLDWYYELGINEEIPRTWDEYKTLIMEYCKGSGLEDQKKFQEETWHKYVERLVEWARSKNYKDEKILKKLKNEDAPPRIRMFFFSEENDLMRLAEKIKEWESISFTHKKKREYTNIRHSKPFQKIVCYSCGKEGHT